jgi:energy-coupling factor transporter ATP-binding protein EcfA2
MSKKITLLRGAPGSGKSTLAKKIAARAGGLIVSADEFLVSDHGYNWSPALAVHAHRGCQRTVEAAMRAGVRRIVVDNTNLLPPAARPYVLLAERHGYQVEVRQPDTPWMLDPAALFTHGTHAVPLDRLEQMVGQFQSMTLDQFRAELGIGPLESLA